MQEYKIQKITDIFLIPEDKFDDFLIDFKAYYHYGKSLASLIDVVAKAKGMDTKTIPQHMIWIDDGKHDAKIRITPKSKPSEKDKNENG